MLLLSGEEVLVGGGGAAAQNEEETEELAAGEEGGAAEAVAEPAGGGFALREFLLFMGPGLLMAVAFLDPGSLQASIQAGAETGFALLWWFAIITLVFAGSFQCMAGWLGLVSGGDLAQQCGRHYPLPARLLLWAVLEATIVAADVQGIVGCAQALSMLTRGQLPLWAGCLVASVTAFALLLLDRTRSARWLEALFGGVIAVEAAALATNYFMADIPDGQLVRGLFVPSVPAGTLPIAVAALGATVMPHNLFFHSSVVRRRDHDASRRRRARTLLWYLRLETLLTLLIAFVITLFVVSVFAYGFFGNPAYPEDTVGLESAGALLGQRFGAAFEYLWAVGLLASGLIATVGLTLAGQVIFVGLLHLEVKSWVQFWGTRLVALAPTLALAAATNASHTYDRINQALNVVQSLLLPFALVPLIRFAAQPKVMGGGCASHPALTGFAAAVAACILAVNDYLLVDLLLNSLPQSAATYVVWAMLVAAYHLALGYFVWGAARELLPPAGQRLARLLQWRRGRAPGTEGCSEGLGAADACSSCSGGSQAGGGARDGGSSPPSAAGSKLQQQLAELP